MTLPEDVLVMYVSQDESTLKTNRKSGFAIVTTEPRIEKYADLHGDDSLRLWKTGVMRLQVIRKDVYSCDLTFDNITYDYCKQVLNALKTSNGGGFYVSLWDDITSSFIVRHMYRADRDLTKKATLHDGIMCDLKVSLIEF